MKILLKEITGTQTSFSTNFGGKTEASFGMIGHQTRNWE
jgi:hypothetical protein